MKTNFTFNDLREFILSQPDEKAVNMAQCNAGPKDCGCVLIHFARHNSPERTNKLLRCGFKEILAGAATVLDGDREVGDFIYRVINSGGLPATYGELKARLPKLAGTPPGCQ